MYTFKNIHGILLLMILILSTHQSFSQTKNFIDQPFLETTASSDTLVIPDRIFIRILLKESDSKNNTSVEELENRLIQVLDQLKIDRSQQLSLIDASTEFQGYFLKGKTIEKQKAYQLLIYDGTMLGKLLMALEGVEISNVALEKLEYSDMDSLKLLLKSRAVKKALKQAKSLVKPLGQHIGTALYISDRNKVYQRHKNFSLANEMDALGGSDDNYLPIEVDFSKIAVRMDVEVKFKIE
ncbi:MAG TPA: SIMPL domain-containing protein [Cytophagales bacterium]|jgi:uncharacterized protein YggE|nr:SIMPL domain-containing protein [Cytophagales bacterium]